MKHYPRWGARVTAGLAAAVLAWPPAANACGPAVEVNYAEAAPIDIFTVTNRSLEAGWVLVGLTIDLEGSRGNLLFDTAADGPGHNAAQAFRSFSDPAMLIAPPDVPDGATSMTLGFQGLARGQTYSFGIDMDDRLAASISGNTIVDGLEVEGARAVGLLASPEGKTVEGRGTFDDTGRAVLNTGLCA